MEAWRICGIMRMSDKVSGKDSGGRARWRIYGTTGMGTAAEEMRDGNRRYVKRIWINGLEGR